LVLTFCRYYVSIACVKHEIEKPEIPRLYFKPEGYTSTADPELLDGLLELLRANGLDPAELVFSGFDGTAIKHGEPLPQYDHIHAMNEAAWRKAIENHEENPAEYADGWDTPCIGLYDIHQLAHVYSSKMNLADVNERIQLSDVVLGDPLDDIPPGEPVEEAVVHKNYPESPVTSAVVGLVFLERE
jgi:hypothetical protein